MRRRDEILTEWTAGFMTIAASFPCHLGAAYNALGEGRAEEAATRYQVSDMALATRSGRDISMQNSFAGVGRGVAPHTGPAAGSLGTGRCKSLGG